MQNVENPEGSDKAQEEANCNISLPELEVSEEVAVGQQYISENLFGKQEFVVIANTKAEDMDEVTVFAEIQCTEERKEGDNQNIFEKEVTETDIKDENSIEGIEFKEDFKQITDLGIDKINDNELRSEGNIEVEKGQEQQKGNLEEDQRKDVQYEETIKEDNLKVEEKQEEEDFETVKENEKSNIQQQEIKDKGAGFEVNQALNENITENTEMETNKTKEIKDSPKRLSHHKYEPIVFTRTSSITQEAQVPVVPRDPRDTPPEEWTVALCIFNFVRPFTERACRDMLESFGKVVDMWMPKIKTHCYVIYERENEAFDALRGTYDLEWPKGGRKLKPRFVSHEEARLEIDRGHLKPNEKSSSFPQNSSFPQTNSTSNHGPSFVPAAVPHSSATLRNPQPKLKNPFYQKPVAMYSLSDLFFKTQTQPMLYFLPLSDEQVKEREKEVFAGELEAERKEMRRKELTRRDNDKRRKIAD